MLFTQNFFYFSYDKRPRGLNVPEDRHSIQSAELKNRVFFRPGAIPTLHIKPVFLKDQANYTCRVDFRIGELHLHFLMNIKIIRVTSS